MKRLFDLLIFSVLFLGSVQVHAQTASAAASVERQDDDEFDDGELLYEVLTATAIENENCKSVLEPTYYEGFRVLLRVYFGELGATDEQIQEEEASAVKHAGYLCKDSAACWRSATRLPDTATAEEGRLACMAQLTESFKSLDEFLVPEDES